MRRPDEGVALRHRGRQTGRDAEVSELHLHVCRGVGFQEDRYINGAEKPGEVLRRPCST
jgi:hypothetical protein